MPTLRGWAALGAAFALAVLWIGFGERLLLAAALFLAGDLNAAAVALRQVVRRHAATDVGARGQYLLGEVMNAAGDPAALADTLERLLVAAAELPVGDDDAARGRAE